MNKIEFAAALSWDIKNVAGRLNALDLLATCNRCGGSGRYSYCQTHGDTCFGCGGSGKGLPRLNVTLVKTVQAKVAAGELDAYLALCKAKKEARALIKPLVAAAEAAYDTIGQAYTVEHNAKRNIMGCPVDPAIFNAQTMNNTLFYGSHYGRDSKRAVSCMSVSEIQSALKYNEVDSLTAVAIIRERVAQLEALRDAFVAFMTSSEKAA
jgi:hypothetical protein